MRISKVTVVKYTNTGIPSSLCPPTHLKIAKKIKLYQ